MPVSTPVQGAVDAINDSMGRYAPESLIPDVEGYLEHLPDVIEAYRDAVRGFADKLTQMPVHPDVAEALKDTIPGLDAVADAAREVLAVFKAKHGPDLERHYNPRANERASNVPA
jgi:hypothetical protein